MRTLRQEVRSAIQTRDQRALQRAMGRFRDSEMATIVAQEELDQADTMTRMWWAGPVACDGQDCGQDANLVAESMIGWLEGPG